MNLHLIFFLILLIVLISSLTGPYESTKQNVSRWISGRAMSRPRQFVLSRAAAFLLMADWIIIWFFSTASLPVWIAVLAILLGSAVHLTVCILSMAAYDVWKAKK